MNRTFLLILRVILFLLVAWNVYFETGIFTTIALILVYGGDEYYTFKNHQVVERLDKLRDRIQVYQDQNKGDREILISDFNRLSDFIHSTLLKGVKTKPNGNEAVKP